VAAGNRARPSGVIYRSAGGEDGRSAGLDEFYLGTRLHLLRQLTIPDWGDLTVADVLVQGLAREVGRSPTPESIAFHGVTGPTSWRCAMSALLVGYARCSTDQQDLTAQRDALLGLGVEAERIYVDHGLTGTNRERPGLREALAACRAGDTLVVTKLDRLARSLPDARAIADELTTRQISLSLGGSVYDPTDAVGRLLFNVLAMVAEFESDLIRLRTREGMKVAKAKGRLRGKQPKLNRRQEAHLVSLVHSGEYSTAEVAELFGVGRSTVYRAIERQRIAAKAGVADAASRR